MKKPPPRYRAGQKIRADQLEELVIWCHAEGIWPRCVRCDRDVGQCLREGDGPIEVVRRMLNGKADRLVPLCSKCSAPRRQAAGIPRPAADGNGGNGAGGSSRLSKNERVSDVATRIIWNAAPNGANQRLWEIAAQIREKGGTWQTIAKELERRYGIKSIPATVSQVVRRRRPDLEKGRGGRKPRGEDMGGSGDPPLQEDDGDIFDDGGSPPPGGPDPEDIDADDDLTAAGMDAGAPSGGRERPHGNGVGGADVRLPCSLGPLQNNTAMAPPSVTELAKRVLGTADAVEAGIRISIGPEPAHRMSLQRPGLRVEIEASCDEEFGDRARRLQAMLEIAKGT